MRPIRTDESNFTYRGPVPSIADLPCQRNANGGVYSVWKLSNDERALIAAGANIELGIFNEPIPPVCLSIATAPEIIGDDDLRCIECNALYVRARGLAACGQCGGKLAVPTPGG